MQERRRALIENVAQKRLWGITVVIEDVHDPHNAAAIMRTCDGLGVQDVRFVFEKEKSYNPRRVGKASSSSANKWLTCTTYHSTDACITALRDEGYTSVVTALIGATGTLEAYDFTAPEKVAIWVGNEHRGISDTAREAADAVLTIPMRGFVESFNVSVAMALFLAEATRQRQAIHYQGDDLSTLVEALAMR